VNVDSKAGAGAYPVSLKISYKDDLRQIHMIDINSKVQFAPERPASESTQNGGIMSTGVLPVGIGAAAAAAIGAAAALRRRKKTALRRTFQAGKDDDIESVLDSHNKQDPK
jgi:MYXO-CTERM domain-containing protein